MSAIAGTEHHPHARAVLEPALPPDGQASHAYLFHGPGGVGKSAAARSFAAALLADGAPDPDGVRDRVGRGTHPDLVWVVPSGAHELLVGDIEQPVVAASSRTPFEAKRCVFVLERADTMVEAAANKMLKTLEEPAPHVHLILLTDRLSEVLPTIASRCQLVRFDPLGEDEVVRRLVAAGVDEASAPACARLSLGDVDRARALALGDGPKLRADAEAFAAAALTNDVGDRPGRALLARSKARGDAAVAALEEAFDADRDLLAKKDRRRAETEHTERTRRAHRREQTRSLDLGLGLAGLWLRDLAAVAWDAEDVVLNADRLPALRAQARDGDPQAFRAAQEAVEDTRRRLLSNVTEELAVEALAYRLARELAGA